MKSQIKLGIIINNIEGRFQSRIFNAVKYFIKDRNVKLNIFNGHSLNSPYNTDYLYNNVYDLAGSLNLDGLLVLTGSMGTNSDDEILKNWISKFSKIPVVTVGRGVTGYSGVISDNKKGIIDAIKHLSTKHDRKKMAFISGPKDSPSSIKRLAAFKEALEEIKLTFDPNSVYYGDYSFKLCKDICENILAEGFLPYDALVCANDEMAWSIQRILEDSGYQVPHDYSITGFDDLPESAFNKPSLSTVNQEIFGQVVAAGEMLLSLIDNYSDPEIKILESSFIRRESCGCSFMEDLDLLNSNDKLNGNYKINNIENFKHIVTDFLNKSLFPSQIKKELNHILFSLVDNLYLSLRTQKITPLFLMNLSEWLEVTQEWESYSEIWFKSINLLRKIFVTSNQGEKIYSNMQDLFSQGFFLISQLSDKREKQNKTTMLDIQLLFRDLSRELNTNPVLESLIDTLKRYLPYLGFTNLSIIIEQADKYDIHPVLGLDDKLSIFIGKKINNKQLIEYLDAAKDISETLVYMSLVSQEKFFGYIVMSANDINPVTFVNLQEEISQALLIIDLFNERQILIDEKVKLIEEYRLSEERYREMIDMVPMLMWETNMRMEVTYINKLAEDKLGLNIGNSIKNNVIAEDKKNIDKFLFNSGEYIPLDYKGIRIKKSNSDGNILIVQINEIKNDNNQVVALRWHALDPLPLVLDNTLPTDDFFKEYNITKREREILLLLYHGLKIREIAVKISLAESTVKGHITKIYNKLGVDDRESLMDFVSGYKIKNEGYGNYLFKIFNQLIGDQLT